MVKVIGVIQARISSNRLPAKVMLDVMGKTLLERVVERVQNSNVLDEIYIATSLKGEDVIIENISKKIGVKCFRGSLDNVFDRFIETIQKSEADIVVRITADNPLTEPNMIDYGVKHLTHYDLDYVGYKNVPVGTAVEIFTAKSFLSIPTSKLNIHNKEHVTSYYYQNLDKYKVEFIKDFYEEDLSNISLTVDTLKDYIKICNIYLNNKQNDLSELVKLGD